MALKTDDEDIRDVRFWMELGGSGDYYINLVENYTDRLFNKRINYRMAMSGGNAPHEVKIAAAALFRAMENYGLNIHPKEDDLKTKQQSNGNSSDTGI